MVGYPMLADDIVQREQVKGEKGGAQHSALRVTAGDVVGVWLCFAQDNVLSFASQIRGEPPVYIFLRVLQTTEEGVVVNRVKDSC